MRAPVDGRSVLGKRGLKTSRRQDVGDKENTPPHPKYSKPASRGQGSNNEEDVLNKSSLRRSLTYRKLNQSPRSPHSRNGSEENRRLSKESIFSVYEDCKETQSRRPSYESIASVYEDCLPPDALALNDLASELGKRCEENKRRSKESVMSEYQDASETLNSPTTDEFEDSLMIPSTKKAEKSKAKQREQVGFSEGVIVESYEVIQQVTEEIVREEVQITETKVLSDSYEVTPERVKTRSLHHEQVTTRTYVHMDRSPQRFVPDVDVCLTPGRFFPPLDEEVPTTLEVHTKDAEKEHSKPVVHANATETTGTQSPTKLLAPLHVREGGRSSFSPVQTTFSPQSPQKDADEDLNESRRDTVTMARPSPALIACHSRLRRAGHAGCVDDVDARTPLTRVRGTSPLSSSTPLPGRSSRKPDLKRRGPSWLGDHLEELPYSPVTRPDPATPLSPRKTLFSASQASDDSSRVSSLTVTKLKPALPEVCPTAPRRKDSPLINTETVTKTRPSIGEFVATDPAEKRFERTVDQSNIEDQFMTEALDGGKRLSSLTVTKRALHGKVHGAVPEAASKRERGPGSTVRQSSFSGLKTADSRAGSGSGRRRSSGGKHKRRSSGGQKRSIDSKTTTRPRSRITPSGGDGGCSRMRCSSKQLFSPQPPVAARAMENSIQPFSPTPEKQLSDKGRSKVAARMKQSNDASMNFPVRHSKVTAEPVTKPRRSGNSVGNAGLSMKARRRSFGNKTLHTNVNRPATKPQSKPVPDVGDGGDSRKLRKTQQRKRSGACELPEPAPQAKRAHEAARDWLERRRRAAVCIQALYRGHTDRKYVQRIRAVIVLQAALRRHIARQQYTASVKAVVVLQKNVRAHQVRTEFLRKKAAATLIQNHFRFHLLRRQFETDFQRMRRAACWIQCWYRRTSSRRSFLRSRDSAVTIQAWWRMARERRVFTQQRDAAITLQLYVRDWLLKRREQLLLKEQREAAVKIQSSWRASKERSSFSRKRNAVVLIQSLVRMRQARKRCEERYQALRVLQRYTRAWCLGKEQQKVYSTQRQACITIQRYVRLWIEKRQEQRSRELEAAAAIIIQTFWRRHRMQDSYKRLKDAVITLQRRVRAWQSGKIQWEVYHIQRGACIVIQTKFRCWLAERAFLKVRQAAVKIQATVRMQQARRRYVRVKAAALAIQTRWRATLQTRLEQERYVQMRAAAIVIQATYRGKRCSKILKKQRVAAVQIQKWYRCYRERISFVTQRAAAITIQRWNRSWTRAKAVQRELALRRRVTVRLQAVVRSAIQRRRFLRLRRSAVVLQSTVRMLQARRLFRRQKEAAVTLQRRWRSSLLGRHARAEFLHQRAAAVAIQSRFRMYAARRDFNTMMLGFTRLQALVRMRHARRRYHETRAAAVTLQKFIRAFVAGQRDRRTCRLQKQRRTEAAVVIQTFYRCVRFSSPTHFYRSPHQNKWFQLYKFVTTSCCWVRAKVELMMPCTTRELDSAGRKDNFHK